MKSALCFLVAAKRAELQALEQFAVACELVNEISRLVHVLQRERGASSLFVASGGRRFGEQLAQHVADSVKAEHRVRDCFERFDTESGRSVGGPRLLSRIAYVLNGFDALPVLRDRIQTLALGQDEVVAALSKLIGGLLSVVFEAADTAADPDVSRALVAMFNFMQGKELAGQERAVGAGGFASGRFDTARQQRLQHLIEAQERCFDIFVDFAAPRDIAQWRSAFPAEVQAELERLRRIALSVLPDSRLPVTHGGEPWFDLATRRIDAMKAIETRLAEGLVSLCGEKMATARADLENHTRMVDSLSALDASASAPVAVFFEQATTADGAEPTVPGVLTSGGLSPHLGRSILDLVQEQSRRLQIMGDELQAVRTTLNERKLIERAKGVLMAHRGLTEDQAYKMLRQTAMEQGRRMADVAESILSLSDLLQSGTQGGRSTL